MIAVTMPAAIGACLRLERGHLVPHMNAQPLQHVLQHMILLHQDPAEPDLERDMPVAEVIGRAHQVPRLGRRDQGQRLLGCDHLNDPPVRGLEPVAAAQDRPALDVHSSLFAGVQRDPQPAFLALVEGEGELVVDWPTTLDAFGDGQHATTPLQSSPPPLRGRSTTRSVGGRGVLSPPSRKHPDGGGSTPLPDLRSDLPLKGGGEDS